MRSSNHSKFAKRIDEEQKNMEDEEEEVEEKNDTKKSENHTTGSKRNYETLLLAIGYFVCGDFTVFGLGSGESGSRGGWRWWCLWGVEISGEANHFDYARGGGFTGVGGGDGFSDGGAIGQGLVPV